MPRIAYICADPGIPIFGRKGGSIHVQEVVRAFRENGATVEVFATRAGGPVPDDLRDVPLHPIPLAASTTAAAREQACLDANLAMAEGITARFDLVYERYSLWSHAGMERAQSLGIPRLLEVNAPLIEEQATHRTLVHQGEAEQVATRAFRTATALIAVSEGVADYLRGWPGGTAPVHVLPNGVNPARFSPAERWRKGPVRPPFTVGFVGSLKPWHGVAFLLDALRLLRAAAPDARLLIVGDGPERPALEAQARSLGLAEAVDFTGAVPPEAVPAWLEQMDVATAPYPALPQFYFSPLKLFEYMAAALPVVASRVGQIDSVIRSGDNGLLVPPGDVPALAHALERLRGSPALRRQLGEAARRSVLAGHTWASVVRRLLAIAGLGAPDCAAATPPLPA